MSTLPTGMVTFLFSVIADRTARKLDVDGQQPEVSAAEAVGATRPDEAWRRDAEADQEGLGGQRRDQCGADQHNFDADPDKGERERPSLAVEERLVVRIAHAKALDDRVHRHLGLFIP